MIEERFELYKQLIQQLLICPEEEKLKLLQANSDLVDLGLLIAMQDVASLLVENNNSDAAEFLLFFSQQLARQMRFNSVDEMYQEYFNCLVCILERVPGNPIEEVMFPLLENHLEKLNLNLGIVLYIWTTETWLSIELEGAHAIAQVVEVFGGLIQRFPLGNIANNLELAIIAYETILSVFTKTNVPEKWAITQQNLSIAYNQRIRGNKAKNVEQAILHSKNALSIYTETINPGEWASTQFYLGTAYLNRIEEKKAENIEQAILHFKNALRIHTQQHFPVQWASIQNNIGNAYLDRIKEKKAENIEQAILHFKNALRIRTQQDFPVKWSATQHNIGNAYRDRIKGDKAQNLEQAILYYNNALQIRTKTNLPEKWAMTQHNLAVAYLSKADLPKISEDKEDNIEQAIKHEKKALDVFTENDYPEDWARIQLNLVKAYFHRNGNKITNLEQAICCAKNALRIYKEASFPFEYAMTQMNLASAFSYLHKVGKDKIKNIEDAIAIYQDVLRIITEIDFPVQWATTQHNLGLIYEDRITTDKANNNTKNLDGAINAYQNALHIYTEIDFPVDCLRTAKNLGDLYFTQGNWQLSIQAYQKAIAAIELTRNWAANDQRRQEIIADAMDVYEKMIQACINNGQLDLAIETTERSRARHLVDLMASNDLYRGGDIPEKVREYIEQYEHLQEKINFLRSSSESSDNRELTTSGTRWRSSEVLSAKNAEINQLEAEKHQIWLQLRRLDPILAGQQQVDPISFAQIQQLIDNQSTAILCCYSTWQDTYIFILYKDKQPQVHTCAGQNVGTLYNEFLRDNWLTPYLQNFVTWRGNIPTVLEQLAKRLQLDQLIEKYLQGIEELIIIPHLLLHQIPFAALPVNLSPQATSKNENLAQTSIPGDEHTRGMKGVAKKPTLSIPEHRQYLGDLFRLRILPSCQILNYCHQRPTLNEQNTMGIVEDASEDLPYTTYECETLASKYNIDPTKRLQRRQATLSEYRKLASQVPILHSSHHGSADSNDPLKSALILSNGTLTLGELLTPGWRKDLQNLSDVYLNNCETNFSVNEITDDLLSIATGFLCAGARSVVSTLWSVDDCASALLAIFYYDFRNSGSSRPQALQQAQQKLRTLTGKQLQEEYLAQLKSNLDRQYQQAMVNVEAAQNNEEIEKYKNFADKIKQQIEHTLPEHCKSSYPFASPFYWAGFISQGLA